MSKVKLIKSIIFWIARKHGTTYAYSTNKLTRCKSCTWTKKKEKNTNSIIYFIASMWKLLNLIIDLSFFSYAFFNLTLADERCIFVSVCLGSAIFSISPNIHRFQIVHYLRCCRSSLITVLFWITFAGSFFPKSHSVMISFFQKVIQHWSDPKFNIHFYFCWRCE